MEDATAITLIEEVRSLTERNQKLERALASSRAREESLWKKIELMRIEERKLEEAEERLCAQLGQLEVEYMEQSKDHRQRLEMERALMEDLQAKAEELEAMEKRLKDAQAKIDFYAAGYQSRADQQQELAGKSSGKSDRQGGAGGGSLERLMVLWYKPIVESLA